MSAVALLVAAGRGERLGSAGPKALVTLRARPLLEWSLDALRAAPLEQIVVALPAGVAVPDGCDGVVGGETRSQSLANALAAADPRHELVLVHDAARPMLSVELVERVLGACGADVDGAIAATPVADTIKQADRELRVTSTLERESLWAVQTPQVFHRAALSRALAVPSEVLAAATDDAWLLERAGGSVRVVPAPAQNFKVTTQMDLRLAELMLSAD